MIRMDFYQVEIEFTPTKISLDFKKLNSSLGLNLN